MLMISMPRGDIRLVRFSVYDSQTGGMSQIDFTEIYLTVKKNLDAREFLFQKTLTNGGIEKIGEGDYQVKIDPEDTNGLAFNKTYPFDIELVYQDEVKQTEFGQLEITPEVTCSWNEVS